MSPRLRVLTDPRLLAYAALLGLAAPLSALQKELRRRRRIRKGGRFDAAMALAPLAPNAASEAKVVFCGASYGEYVMLERVARELRRRRPEASIAYAIRDSNSVATLRAKHPDPRVSLFPPNALFAVLRWLETERPDLVVLAENFRHPMLIAAARRFGARVALVNGRCRVRRGWMYGLTSPFYRWQFRGLDAMAMQSEAHRRAAEPYAPQDGRLFTSGDLKTDLNLPEPNLDLDRWLADGLPWVVAGSTETAEEERLVVEAFLRTRSAQTCRLLVAPRQPRHIEGLLETLRAAGLSVSRRSQGDPPAEATVLDTMGELTAAYRHGIAAYVGGSYTAGGGGHNVMEPLLWGVPVAFGPQRGHFAAIQSLVEESGAGVRIHGVEELSEFWTRSLLDGPRRRSMGEKGRALLAANRGAIERTLEALLRLLPPSASVPEAREPRTATPVPAAEPPDRKG